MKRKPKIEQVEGKDTLSAYKQTRRKGMIPSQTRISVQDVIDYSTPAGSSMANEEMRRIRLELEQQRKSVEQMIADAKAGGADDGDGAPTSPAPKDIPDSAPQPPTYYDAHNYNITEWALTGKHKGEIVGIRRLVQSLNFIDGQELGTSHPWADYPILFNLESVELEQMLKTLPMAHQINIRAKAKVPDWGPSIRRLFELFAKGGCIEKHFNYNDVTLNEYFNVGTIPIDTMLSHAVIEVIGEWTEDTRLIVGNKVFPALYMTSNTFHLGEINRYSYQIDGRITQQPETVIVSLDMGSAKPTEGEARIIIYYEYIQERNRQ